jgi:hypothetical protein
MSIGKGQQGQMAGTLDLSRQFPLILGAETCLTPGADFACSVMKRRSMSASCNWGPCCWR